MSTAQTFLGMLSEGLKRVTVLKGDLTNNRDELEALVSILNASLIPRQCWIGIDETGLLHLTYIPRVIKGTNFNQNAPSREATYTTDEVWEYDPHESVIHNVKSRSGACSGIRRLCQRPSFLSDWTGE